MYEISKRMRWYMYITFPGNAVLDHKVFKYRSPDIVEYDVTFYTETKVIDRFIAEHSDSVIIVTSVLDPYSQFGFGHGSDEEQEFCTKFKVYDMNTMKLIYS